MMLCQALNLAGSRIYRKVEEVEKGRQEGKKHYFYFFDLFDFAVKFLRVCP
jgi:hypothetical protein